VKIKYAKNVIFLHQSYLLTKTWYRKLRVCKRKLLTCS